MQKRPLRFLKTDEAIATTDLPKLVDGWLLDCEISQCSDTTLANRRLVLGKLVWFLNHRSLESCGSTELRLFLAYLNRDHSADGGRWGTPHRVARVCASTAQTYHGIVRAFFSWLVLQSFIETSPLDAIPSPEANKTQIEPFTQDQVRALLAAACKSHNRLRDEAICLFLLDTGVRATELCNLKVGALDITGRKCRILGKGNKERTICFSGSTAKAIWNHLRAEDAEPSSPLFAADRGRDAGEPLTRSGLLQLIERLGERASITGVRCSPHTFRHTFAVEFLRDGGNVFALQTLLGHSDVKQSMKYVKFVEADIETQHRRHSPVDRLRRNRRGGS